jgi:Fe-S-cluster containining protein
MLSVLERVPECQQCGVCCFSNLERYVAVTGDDYSRLGDDAAELVQFIENKAYMRLVEGHCAALVRGSSLQFSCSVYPTRPGVCRELERGSAGCAGERSLKSARPLLMLGTGILHEKGPYSTKLGATR